MEFGCDINSTDCWGESPIFDAQDSTTTEPLLLLGADVSIVNNAGGTAVTNHNLNALKPDLALCFAEHIQALLAVGFHVGESNLEAFIQTKDRYYK